MKPSTVEKLQPILRWILGVLLLWAAVSKLANPTEFLGSIYAYRFPFPKPALQMVAVILPWIELLCGLLLIVNLWTESALACTAGLFLIFLIATGQAWARQLNISCGCFDLKVFGLHDSHPKLVKFLESPGFAFCRNLALISLTLFLLRKKLDELKPAVVATPKLPGKTGKPIAPARGRANS